MFLFTDLPFDIEEIITTELDVLLSFRKSTKHFKDLIKFNKRALKKMNGSYLWNRSNNPYLKMVMCGEQNYVRPPSTHGSIYGFNFISYVGRMYNQDIAHRCELEVTVAQLNDKLTELGAKRFKSKSKKEKINLLMSDGKYHRRYELTN